MKKTKTEMFSLSNDDLLSYMIQARETAEHRNWIIDYFDCQEIEEEILRRMSYCNQFIRIEEEQAEES